MAPVVNFIVKPPGRAGDKLYASGVDPPNPITGINAIAGAPTVRDVAGTIVIAANGFTVRLKVAEAEASLTSVAVMVKVVDANGTVAIPEMIPVGDIARPVGKAGLIARVSCPSPPETATGVKGEPVARFLVKIVDGTRVVAFTAESTVKLKAAVAVAPF
jgi:hypothetical protein